MIPPGLHRPDAVPLPEGEGWTGCGPGFAAYGEALALRHGSRLATVDREIFPSAAALPFYLRDRVALKTSER